MDVTSAATLDEVREVLAEVLAVDGRTLNADTPLLGGLPEFDSMAVVEVVAALESRFGFEIDDEEVTGEMFETLGSLAAFVEGKRA